MKITGYKLYKVLPRWIFLKIETDEGIVGWGEPVLEEKPQAVFAAVQELMDYYVIGKNPLDIERMWSLLYRSCFYRGGGVLMSAISGIDQALWDIKGKYHNISVSDLLGGSCRDQIKVYCWVGGDRPDGVAQAALEKKKEGFKAIKMNGVEELQYIDTYDKIDQSLERVSAIRSACGKEFGIGIDFHGRVHKPMAKILAKKLEEFDPMFIEEPVLCENMESFRDIAQVCAIPLATGERLFSRWDFKRILEQGYIDIIQPDVSHAGGITETKKITAMAEAYDVAVALHCPLGPIALAACLHVDAISYNAVIQEQSMGIHYNQGKDVLDYLSNPEIFHFQDGYSKIPSGAGLGVDINEELVEEISKIGHNYKNPTWYHKDGSIAEW